MSHAGRKFSGFSMLEVMLAFAVLAVGLMALYAPMSRALLLSETNKQIKIALFDAQSIVEELAGTPFDGIMDPDYPNFDEPNPLYRHRQEVDHKRLFGINPATLLANAPRLEDQRVTVTYGARLDDTDADGDNDRSEVFPLPHVPGSQNGNPVFHRTTNTTEQWRPAKNTPDEFRTPEPLYITVEVSWVGPTKATDSSGVAIRMVQKLTFMRTR